MPQSEEELKSLLISMKEESEKPGLKFTIQKSKFIAFSTITSWQIKGEKFGNNDRFWGGDLQNHCGYCSHETKICLLPGRKAMTNLDSMSKSKGITLPTKVHLVKAMVFPVVTYGCECWTLKKIE